MGSSLAGGVPTALPVYEPSRYHQGELRLDRSESTRREISPGVILVSGWLAPNEQQALVDQFREWALPPAGLRHPRVPRGHVMSVQSVCLGWHWQPYAYSRTADDTDGAPVKPLTKAIARLGRRAVADTFGTSAGREFEPDAVIANLYEPERGSGFTRTPRNHLQLQS
jgi:alkylated DNA repair protein (DNA oxidative demethylase)